MRASLGANVPAIAEMLHQKCAKSTRRLTTLVIVKPGERDAAPIIRVKVVATQLKELGQPMSVFVIVDINSAFPRRGHFFWSPLAPSLTAIRGRDFIFPGELKSPGDLYIDAELAFVDNEMRKGVRTARVATKSSTPLTRLCHKSSIGPHGTGFPQNARSPGFLSKTGTSVNMGIHLR